MILGEVLILLAILMGGGLGASAIISWAHRSEDRRKSDQDRITKKYDDLRDALASGDYRRLDDWLIIYGSEVKSEVKKHVEERRDELYLEKNP